MEKSTSTNFTDETQCNRAEHNDRQTLRVALRLWGFEESHFQSWMGELPRLNGLITWAILREKLASDADIVVHVVKPSRATGSAFCWNCAGANYALMRSLSEGRTDLVLFSGNERQLPRARAGHWAVAGRLSPRVALGRLAHLIAASSTHLMEAGAVRRDLLSMIAQKLDVD
ncbi:hypothetical protein FAZ95_01105 [Trinickia violacea]|uniref:Uncharacterized protein n=1 Tax=Trinickia violacea TaxID=2571746 RepID=A0A4P8IPR7_9BURK|nr:hypothetical protein [Trinickia violacea]QCP47899.1 hypothetical protein FAZ95_01105 [Trinickia violacea]